MDENTQAPAEYPKMLYKGGEAYDAETGRLVPHQYAITVNDAQEQADAEADGYTAYTPPGPEEEPAEAEAPEGEDTTGQDSVAADAGSDTLAGDAGADSVAGADTIAG